MSGTEPNGRPPEQDRAAVPNSPSSAFAALSLDPSPSSSSSTPFTKLHLSELPTSTSLVASLNTARLSPKPLIRSTGHLVPSSTSPASSHHILSWKVAEFAYRKSSSIGHELPTLVRGLFTERIDSTSSQEQHRIVVRGYDKFFNLGELPWVKPASIEQYTTPPYVLTFKENGCIIFVSSLSPTQLVVTSKHSLGSIEGTEVTHAQKGHEWLLRHLSSVNKTESDVAKELWERNETAAFELCDDSFEEHVLAYTPARSGLHLHGLNLNSASFSTRSMEEVDAFAKEYGFIPTRWITLRSLEEVERVTKEIEQTGAWEGEPIEGFVIRTHMPSAEEMEKLEKEGKGEGVVKPPYAAGQAWFYKVKFDEPYLMYRDWRELARKMLREKEEWEAKVASSSSSTSSTTDTPEPETPSIETVDGEERPSKSTLKRQKKALAKQTAAHLASARASGLSPPPPPSARSRRPETLLFIQWCYDRLYGNPSLQISPQPSLFEGLQRNKGIIAMREAFLSHLASSQGVGAGVGVEQEKEEDREFTKTILTPIAVPGCGKTILAVALGELFGVGHVQSDAFKAKKGFLGALERDLRTHAADPNYVLFADKNNHLLQHRDELIDLATRLSKPSPPPQGRKSKAIPEIGRVRTVALAWNLDTLPLNTLHRICASRIEGRGDNHQSLIADTSSAITGLKSHEVVLWRFLEALQPFNTSQSGEGAEGWGDAAFHHVIKLPVQASAKENLTSIIKGLSDVLGWKMPSEERLDKALEKAFSWRVDKKPSAEKKGATEGGEGKGPRYFGLAVEMDVRSLLDSLLSPTEGGQNDSNGGDSVGAFYTRIRSSTRLNLRPHITLVHNSNLSPPETPPNQQNQDDRKWAFYTNLLSSSSDSVFTITLSALLYEPKTLLTFPIDTITPPSHLQSQFEAKHGSDWTPHITIATRDAEVRPYEANRVVSQWLQGGKEAGVGVEVIKLKEPLTVEARVFGMT